LRRVFDDPKSCEMRCEKFMSGSDNGAGIPLFVDFETQAETAALALLDEHEFAQAQAAVPDLNAYGDYQEWRETREGFEMGLAMAGIDVKMINVALTPFLAWCRGGAARPSERSLDDFARTALQTLHDPSALAMI
jgi:hypothetical protein